MGDRVIEWLPGIAAIALVMIMLPWVARAGRAVAGRKGVAGIGLTLGLLFASLFDPARRAGIEHLQRRKEVGDEGPAAPGPPDSAAD